MSSEDPSERNDEPRGGPNLTVIYSFLGAAILAALAIAAMIVLPFYRHR